MERRVQDLRFQDHQETLILSALCDGMKTQMPLQPLLFEMLHKALFLCSLLPFFSLSLHLYEDQRGLFPKISLETVAMQQHNTALIHTRNLTECSFSRARCLIINATLRVFQPCFLSCINKMYILLSSLQYYLAKGVNMAFCFSVWFLTAQTVLVWPRPEPGGQANTNSCSLFRLHVTLY